MNSLPVSRIVNVAVVLTPAGAQAQSLSNLLLLGTSTIIDTLERNRRYSTLTEVATDFGTNAEEYKAAALWFEQVPQPTEIIVGRWVNTAAAGGLRGGTLSAAPSLTVWNAITNGGFKYSKDGAAEVNVTGLNFTAAANLNAVAAIIQAALVGVTCVWNATYGRFEFASTTLGPTSSVAFLNAPTAGTNIAPTLGASTGFSGAYLFVGQAAETAVAAVTAFDQTLGQQWYAVVVPSAVNADHLAISAFVAGTNTKHIYGVTTQEAGVLVAVTTTDIASQLKALAQRRALVQYSSSNPYAVVSALARILTTDYTANSTVITLKFKQEPGIAAEALNSVQVAALQNKNCNVFVAYNNDTAIFEQGVMSDGTFVDIVTGTDWLATDLQRSLYNLLYTSPTKIPQTDQGQQLLLTTCEAICQQGVINGLLAPGVWNSSGFGILKQGDYLPKGFYVYSALVATQNPADRAARRAIPIQIAAKLAGAIHDVNVTVSVNQ
jgi:Protein of unknown function (DUF3383)